MKGLILIFLLLCFNSEAQKTISNFSLKNVDNKIVSTANYKNSKGFIIIFTSNKCPMAKFYSQRMNKLNAAFKSKGVYLLTINSMDTLVYAEESFSLMQKRAMTEKFNFPYLQDKMQVIAKQLNARHTPQAFVLWKNKFGKMTIKYQGAIDDNAGDEDKATPQLANAVNELLANKKVTYPKTESFGCRIFFRGEKQVMD